MTETVMNMKAAKTMTHLDEIDLFGRCTPSQRRRARALATLVDVAPGAVLAREGDQAAEFFVVLDGEATLSVRGTPVGCVQAGEFFGEQGLLDREPRRATVTACTAMALLVYTRIEFLALLETAPSVSIQIVRSRGRQRSGEQAAPGGTAGAPAPAGTAVAAMAAPALV